MPRHCFIIQEGQCDEGGYIPSLVTEHEAGHSPLRGDPAKFQTPWYWGKTYEQAKKVCAAENARLGLSGSDVIDIVASSIGSPPLPEHSR